MYEDLEGWDGDSPARRAFDDLPGRGAERTWTAWPSWRAIPVRCVSVGPDRDQTLEVPG